MNSLKLHDYTGVRLLLAAAFLLSLLAGFSNPASAAPENEVGAVYTLTNSPAGNKALVYSRSADGSLAFQAAFATGGFRFHRSQ